MAIGIYPTFNPPVPEAQFGSDGKLLGLHLEMLDRLADTAGVPRLNSFMDQRVPGDDVADIDDFMASWQEWFAIPEGIRAVEGLLSALRDPSNPAQLTGDAIYLPNQLEAFLRCLRLAEGRGAQFRIEVAM